MLHYRRSHPPPKGGHSHCFLAMPAAASKELKRKTTTAPPLRSRSLSGTVPSPPRRNFHGRILCRCCSAGRTLAACKGGGGGIVVIVVVRAGIVAVVVRARRREE